jgi:hypothetical protein
MFEVSGDDIIKLSDVDLRSLVTRLAIAELRAKGYPRSSVTAGGNQDAADGGLDVRVECPTKIVDPDFVPRRLTGFQVKKPDMPSAAIRDEMRPKGVLRNVIGELADASGAYVIISSQGSVADKPLADRRKAMRDALNGVVTAAQLHTDFYDRDRLATWANEYPGIAAWIRSSVGRPLSGWSGIGNWEGGRASSPLPYLFDDKACLIVEGSRDHEHLPIAEGIARLRAALRTSRQCIRLVGLSGLGKTRLIQALFEESVGADPLDSSLAVYTDYSEETDPTARDMARELVARQQRAILVVDNCNPDTHSELARLCSGEGSEVSLITVEYDVRDDEPEHTEVFRLQSASPELVSQWLKQIFPDISQIDGERIAEFSDGNFRVARALAETLGKGETLGILKSRALFERIFHQRNQQDRSLLQAAEDLSLLYSIDGDDVSPESELARVGAIRDIGAQSLYEALAEMRQRGVVQARGRFRAILPQAIANPLAAHALDRIPPASFDEFCRGLTPRMLKSVSRRLGFLHDSLAAQAAVARWLRSNGPLGNLLVTVDHGFEIITNIAPVSPEMVLARLEQELTDPNNGPIRKPGATGHLKWIRLIKAIGYDASLFDRSATILARLIPAESDEGNSNSGRDAFSEFFHIYLSGTQATPEQRRALIRRFSTSEDDCLRRSGRVALRAILKSDGFMSMGTCDFGARPRDWGWHPRINKDIWDWFEGAIDLVIELSSQKDARVLVASAIRGLWRFPTCRAALDRAATVFVQKEPWIEGWVAFRATLRYDGKDMPRDVRSKLEEIIERLKSLDLLNEARAIILHRAGSGWDFYDGEDDEEGVMKPWEKARRMAQEIGSALAKDAATRAAFLKELLANPRAERAFECGGGLAQGAEELEAIWFEITSAYATAEPQTRNAMVLSGFISQARGRDQYFASQALDAAIANADLLPILPYLQARAGMDAEGISRLRRAITEGGLEAWNFRSIANGSVTDSPPESLAALLEDIAALPAGINVALDVLQMHFHGEDKKGGERNLRLMLVGRDLLARADFNEDNSSGDYGAGQLIRICLAGEEGEYVAKAVCESVRSAIDSYKVSPYHRANTLHALFEAQPYVALDAFLLPEVSRGFDCGLDLRSPIQILDLEILQTWASADPCVRYSLLGNSLNMFCNGNGGEGNEISPLFLSMLERAPSKKSFLGDWWERLHPRSWSGSLADILVRRKEQVGLLTRLADVEVDAWINEIMPELDRVIEHERGRDRSKEESFE